MTKENFTEQLTKLPMDSYDKGAADTMAAAQEAAEKAVAAAVAAEREACAKKWIETHGFDKHGVAEFIRSRGST